MATSLETFNVECFDDGSMFAFINGVRVDIPSGYNPGIVGFELLDSGGDIAENWDSRILVNSSGVTIFDWELPTIYGSGGVASINPESRDLIDASGSPAVNWDARTLLASDGVTVIAQWGLNGLNINNTGARIMSGSGTPEGVMTAEVGSLFMRTDGGANTTLYVKESGSGNTGWVPK